MEALLREGFAERFRCIYLDPPYNTGNRFAHYADAAESGAWLEALRARLLAARRLLRPDGFLCGHIDDSEGPYLKVLMDEVLGRDRYLATLYVRVRYAGKTLKRDMHFHKEIEQIHVYGGPGAVPRREPVPSGADKFRYRIVEIGPGVATTLGGKHVVIFGPGEYSIEADAAGSGAGLKEIWASGAILDGNSSGRFFRDHLAGRAARDGLGVLYKVSGIGDDGLGHRYFTGPKRPGATQGKYYQGMPAASSRAPRDRASAPVGTFHDLAAAFGNCRHEGGTEFRSGKKPERLLALLLRHFTGPGDWVLDPYGGSGTTAAVAHKLGRRWVTIESGPQCETRILPRLRRVAEGEDRTGITADAGWRGGGGFRFYRLDGA